MKLIYILVLAVVAMPINPVFAQKNTHEFEHSHSTRSKKELMKMEVISRPSKSQF